MFGFERYNYDRFRRELFAKNLAEGKFGAAPEPGERAPDFELRSLNGDKIRLSSYRGLKNVVLTFGSATCPQTATSIGELMKLEREFRNRGVQFLFVYVREAHPGELLPSHRNMADKARAAELLREEEEIECPVLVDELNGNTHRRYGSLPNPTFLIDRSGRIAFRSLGSNTDRLGEALEELLERQEERGVDHAIVGGGEDLGLPSVKMFFNVHRALERGGHESMRNFRNEMGLPGRMALTGARVVRPVAENPGTAAATALAVAGVLGIGLWVGRELRRRRFEQTPYRYPVSRTPRHRAGDEGDYEAVGI